MTAFQVELVRLAGNNLVDRDVLMHYAEMIEILARDLLAEEEENDGSSEAR